MVPVLFGDAIQCREHDGHDNLIVLLYERHNVLVIPEIQSPLCNLKKQNKKVKKNIKKKCFGNSQKLIFLIRSFKVDEKALCFWNNKYILWLIQENNQVFIPIMFLALYCISIKIQRREHDGNDNLIVFLYERHNVLGIPEIQSLLCNLKKTPIR